MDITPDRAPAFLTADAPEAAPQLLGWRLLVHDGTTDVGGAITEVEAYTQEDAASHAFRGPTARNATMFGPASHVYVYLSYGIHWCMNIVTGPAGHGQGVLIRAIAPEVGVDVMKSRRGITPERPRPDRHLTNGPGKVCQALGITGADNGIELGRGRVSLMPPALTYRVRATERIGISRDTHRLWRFVAH